MTIQTILVALNDISRVEQLAGIAAKLAERHDAHVIGLYVIPAIVIHPGISMHVSPEVIDAGRRFYTDAAEEVRATFEKIMEAAGRRCEWRLIDAISSNIADAVTVHARQADLVVVGQINPESNTVIQPDFVEDVVMHAGRPVLVVPYIGTYEDVGSEVIVAWNGSREAARSAFDALPLFKKDATARIVWVDADTKDNFNERLPGAELATSFARHGINAISEPASNRQIGAADVLLNHGSDVGADLLVMGAYGHSRMREYVFGGVTRDILLHMTVPVLMSH